MFRRVPGPLPVALVALATLLTWPVRATTLTVPVSGTSAAGNPVSFTATFTTAGDTLSLTLANTSTTPTSAPADVLSSFYFDLLQNGVRPKLAYAAASGLVYEVLRDEADRFVPGRLPGGATDLRALTKDAGTWQFRAMNPGFPPGLGFGIGTVGNSNIGSLVPGSTQTFDGPVVRGTAPRSMINLGIYSTGTGTATDINPVPGLDGARLVRTEAVFSFTSDKDLDSLTTTWVQGNVTFGFGTNPDSVLLPEPASLSIASLGGLLAAGWRLRARAGRSPACLEVS